MLKKTLVLILVFHLNFLFSQQENEIYHRAKIYYNSEKDFKELQRLGLALDHGKHKKGVYIESDFSESQLNAVKTYGAKVEIIINNIQNHYLNRNIPSHKSYIPKSTKKKNSCSSSPSTGTYTTPKNYNNGSMGGYLTYAEMLQELDDMARLYPKLITTKADVKDPENANRYATSQNRFLQYVKISDNPNTDESAKEPQTLYTAIHHAREPMSLQQTIFYMWYLLENYDSDKEIKRIIDNTELFFIPCINPDGYIYNQTRNPNGGGLWRKNRRNNGGSYGVDNNRNYSYIKNGREIWNTAGTSGPNGETYAGPSVFSEPENKSIRWFVDTHNFSVALNAHSFSNLLLYPHGYASNVLSEDDSTFKTISSIMVAENKYTNQLSADLYPAAGGSDDFMYGLRTKESGAKRNKIFAMTPEIGSSFWPAANQITDICKDMIHLNLIAAKIPGNYATIEENNPITINTTTTNINYKIQRLGLKEPANFTVSINPISANISSVGSPNNHTGLNLMQEITSNISLNLKSSISTGEDIVFELVLNNGFYDEKILLTKKYGMASTVLNELGNDTSTLWDNSDWGVSRTEYFSESSSITDSPTGNYPSNANKIIQLSSNVSLESASKATLSFYTKWDIENNFDYVQLQISTDNGASWIPLCGKHTNQGVPDQTGANNEPVYDGVQNSWVKEEISLDDYLGNNILIRFQLVSDMRKEGDGFYFDDLKIEVFDTALNVEEHFKLNFSIYPNPTNQNLNIQTNITNYNYKLYTLHGQTILESKNSSLLTQLDLGHLSTGVYFIDIEKSHIKETFKIIKL